MISKFNQILKSLRREKGLTQDELGKALEVTRQSVSNYENGIRDPDYETLEKIADYFNVDMNYLLGRSKIRNSYADLVSQVKNGDIYQVPKNQVPLLGTIAAGSPILAQQHIEEYISIDTYTKADFCLRVKGDSMIGANIQDGDIVFIRIQNDVEDGEIAAVLIEDSATLKRVFKFGDHVQLRAENPNIKPIILNGDRQVKILGKAVYRITKI